MSKKLTYQSTFNEVGWSLRETLNIMETQGETVQLKFDMLLKYGRLLLMEGKAERAYEVFQQCSNHALDNGVWDLKELYYWSTRSIEEKGEMERAKYGYLMLLDREAFIKDEEFVNAVLDRLSLFGDITELVNGYKKKRRRIKQSQRFVRQSPETVKGKQRQC